jgi:hypothetical protein
MPFLGSDFAGTDSIDWDMTFREGEAQEQIAYQEAIARRYLQPRGGLFYDPSNGLDIRVFVADHMPVQVAQGLIVGEAFKDPRTADCQCVIDIQEDSSWLIQIQVAPDNGPTYPLTFMATATTIEQLNA